MNLDVLSDLIVAAGQGVVGTSLFQHHMPDDCKRGIVLKHPLDGIRVNHQLPGLFKSRIQAIVRDANVNSGNQRSVALANLLTIPHERDFLDGQGRLFLRIHHFYPASKPIFYPRSPGNLFEWSISFDAIWLEL